jgi:group I intron endonuclease
MEILNKPGIYLIYNLANQRVYVGQSKNVRARLETHKKKLRNSHHPNPYLLNAFNHYGEDKFVFRSVEYPEDCSPENLTIREQHWIDQFNSMNPNRGYNLRPASKNDPHTPEVIAILREKSKGRIKSEEERAKLSAAKTGQKHTPEAKAKMSAALRLRVITDETKARLSAAKKGHTKSEEARTKIKDSVKNLWNDPEYRQKMIEARKLAWAKRKQSSE